MNNLYEIREQIIDIYKDRAQWIIIGLRFILSLVVLFYIKNNIGYMTMLNTSLILVGIAIVCALLPLGMLAFASAVLICLHTYTASMVIAAIVSCVFLFMFIIYLRFTSKQMLALIITPVALAWNIPFVVPMVYGLLGNPITIVPMAFGVVIYYMIQMIAALPPVGVSSQDGTAGLITEALTFAKDFSGNKDMMLMILLLGICLAVVWGVRQTRVDHSWKYAICAGMLTNIIASLVLGVTLGVSIEFFYVILGSILAGGAGIVAEFLFLSIDYSRTEYLEYEDDEYHYYVKAVPIISVAKKEKTVKRINDVADEDETEEQNPQEHVRQERVREEHMREEHMREKPVRPRKAKSSKRLTREQRRRMEYRAECRRKLMEESQKKIDTEESIDTELGFGETTVIQTDDIEKELRNNAMKNENVEDINAKNSRVNMEILNEFMKKELDIK